ncbi:MAG: hypothetical protein KDI42_10565 [Gammaproteobacteria bacterium]|nr:hypothetical protein [Gammaproteobacteria bacterium]
MNNPSLFIPSHPPARASKRHKVSTSMLQFSLFSLLIGLAQIAAAGDLRLSGFGSLSLSCFSNDQADYVINLQPVGPGRTGQCDAGLDSTIGVQADLRFNESLEFGVQTVVDRNVDRGFDPDTTVVQLRWHLYDDTTVRVGRSPASPFLYSETRMVKFVMPWIRPPMEVYGISPTFTQDGVEVLHNLFVNDWKLEWQAGLSEAHPTTPVGTNQTRRANTSQAFINFSLESSDTLVKLGYNMGRVTLDQDSVTLISNTLRSVGAGTPQAQLADELPLADSDVHLLSFGVRHETADWFIQGEAAYRTMEGYFRDQLGAYLSIGKHSGSWTPYLTVARRTTSGPDTDSRAGALTATVDSLLAATRFDSTSLAIGVSRELNDQATVKLQVDWIKPDKDSWGLYTNHGPSYDYATPDTDILISVGVDFVF